MLKQQERMAHNGQVYRRIINPWGAPVAHDLESNCRAQMSIRCVGGPMWRVLSGLACVASLTLGAAVILRADATLAKSRPQPAAARLPARGPQALRALRQWSAATSWLYASVAPALVQVKLGRNPDVLLPGAMRKEFRVWRKNWLVRRHFLIKNFERRHSRGAPTIVIRPGVPGARGSHVAPRATGHVVRRPPPWLNSPRGRLMLLRRFLVHRFRKTHQPQPVLWKMVNQRIKLLQQSGSMRVLGLAVGQKRRVLVLMILAFPKTHARVSVILPDGKKARATVLGTDFFHGLTVLKLPRWAALKPLPLARRLPREGQLLMCLGSGRGAVSWITAVMPSHHFHHHLQPAFLALPFHQGQRAFVFNLRGHLTALALRPLAAPVRMMRNFLIMK